jgi:SAM-dependent methyltransferase
MIVPEQLRPFPMPNSSGKDAWNSGDAYEPYVGRWSRLVADRFISWLNVPNSSKWLDVGCGTGALTAAILKHADPARITAIDPSADFIAYAHDLVSDARVDFHVADAQALPADNHAFDVTVSGLVLNFIPDISRAVSEMVRATRPGGQVAAYVWDYAGEMQMMRHFWSAAGALDPAAREKDEGRRFPICREGPLSKLFSNAGLDHTQVRAIDVPTVFRDFDDYWTPFLGGQAPAPGYCMSLSEEHRAALRERIRMSLPTNDNGSIHLVARAWVVRGTVHHL